MTAPQSCPPPEVLAQLLRGGLPPEEAESLAKHLEECDHCTSRAHTLPGEDTLVESARSPVPPAGQPDPTATQLIRKLRRTSPEPIVEILARLAPPQGPDELGRLGPYRVLKVLGAGGMGVVFQAEDLQLERPVALKVPRVSLAASPALRQRFRREALSLAAFYHDNVVTIHRVGEDNQLPFLVMEFLEGESLDRRLCRQGKLPVPEVLRIGQSLAAGLAAAHGRGLIHRDVKPANVFLARGETESVVKLLDFGLARTLGDDTRLTRSGALVGTPAYMAPEQAEGAEADARCDLFSLGCVLYHAATGHPPFQGDTTAALLRALHSDCPRPAHEVNPQIPPALSDLLGRLLERDPDGRPASAAFVAGRLKEIEAGTARPCQPREGRRRHRLPFRSAKNRWFILGTAVLLALLAAWLLARRQGPVPPSPFDRLRREAIPPYELMVAGNGRPQRAPAELVAVLGDSRFRHSDAVVSLAFSPDSKRLASAGDDGTVRLWEPETGREVRMFPRQPQALKGVAFGPRFPGDPSSDRLAVVGFVHVARVWDAGTGEEVAAFRGHPEGRLLAVAYSPDGKRIASAGHGRLIRIWDAHSGQEVLSLEGHTNNVTALGFSPDGDRLASGGWDTTVRIHNARGGKELFCLRGHTARVLGVCFSPDGRKVASCGQDQAVKVWDADEGSLLCTLPGPLRPARSVAFSPDGKQLAAALDTSVRVWAEATGSELLNLRRPGGEFHSVAFSPDGRLLAAGDHTRVIVWDRESGREVIGSAGHQGRILAVAVSPDGRRLATASQDGSARIWDTEGKELLTLPDHAGPVTGVAFLAGGRELVTTSHDGNVRLWDAEGGRLVRVLGRHDAAVRALAYHPTGRLATAGYDRTIRVWDEEGKELFRVPAETLWVESASFSGDGKLLAAVAGERLVKVWDAEGKEVRALAGHTTWVTAVAFQPGGSLLACGSNDGAIKLWEAVRGEEVRTLASHTAGIGGVGFSPDGRLLASGGLDGKLVLTDVRSGKVIQEWQTPHQVLRVVFAPDGRHLLAGNGSGTIHIYRLGPARE